MPLPYNDVKNIEKTENRTKEQHIHNIIPTEKYKYTISYQRRIQHTQYWLLTKSQSS